MIRKEYLCNLFMNKCNKKIFAFSLICSLFIYTLLVYQSEPIKFRIFEPTHLTPGKVLWPVETRSRKMLPKKMSKCIIFKNAPTAVGNYINT